MMDVELLKEARQDIKDVKDFLSSIDKNLTLYGQKLDTVTIKQTDLETRTLTIEQHVNFVNSSVKLFAVIGGIFVFFAEVWPFIQSFLQ